MRFQRNLLVIIFFLVISVGYSQPNPDSPPCIPPFDVPTNPNCAIPIDGGVGLLIAAGLAFGGKKIKDSSQKVD